MYGAQPWVGNSVILKSVIRAKDIDKPCFSSLGSWPVEGGPELGPEPTYPLFFATGPLQDEAATAPIFRHTPRPQEKNYTSPCKTATFFSRRRWIRSSSRKLKPLGSFTGLSSPRPHTSCAQSLFTTRFCRVTSDYYRSTI